MNSPRKFFRAAVALYFITLIHACNCHYADGMGYDFLWPVQADLLTSDVSPSICPSTNQYYFISLFGPRFKRVEYMGGVSYYDFHQGEDITSNVTIDGHRYSSDPTNLYPLLCACNGMVDEIIDEDSGEQGRTVRIRCKQKFREFEDDTIYIKYSHLSEINPNVTAYSSITKADTIGFVGASGNTTLVHLHFSVQRKIGPSHFDNVHPMRLYRPTDAPHISTELTDFSVERLPINEGSVVLRFAIPHNQVNIRSILLVFNSHCGARVSLIDFEKISADYATRDNPSPVEGLTLFPYRFIRSKNSYATITEEFDQIPANYPIQIFPITQSGVYNECRYILDIKCHNESLDMAARVNFADARINVMLYDIWGNMIEREL